MPLCSSSYSDRQMAGRMELTASGRPAMMRCSVRKRRARILTTYSWGKLAAEAPRSGVYYAS